MYMSNVSNCLRAQRLVSSIQSSMSGVMKGISSVLKFSKFPSNCVDSFVLKFIKFPSNCVDSVALKLVKFPSVCGSIPACSRTLDIAFSSVLDLEAFDALFLAMLPK